MKNLMEHIFIGNELNDLLKNVTFVPPDTSFPSKIDMDGDYKQFSLTREYESNKYNFQFGPAIELLKEFTLASKDEALKFLSMQIEEWIGVHKAKCHLLALPSKGVEFCNLEIDGYLEIRYIKDYLPAFDQLVDRWDLLIERGI